MKDIDGYNDRCILILLEHKEFKTKKEKPPRINAEFLGGSPTQNGIF